MGWLHEEARIELNLVGKVWTYRKINVNAFISTIKNVWNPMHDVEMSNSDKNTYMFQFHHWRDKKRVLDEQPWYFDRLAVIFNEVDPLAFWKLGVRTSYLGPDL